MGILKGAAGLVNTKISMENAVTAIQKLYAETEKLNPGDDPHSLLIKTALSRIHANNKIRRLKLTEDQMTLMSYRFSITPSFLPKGLNSKLLALQIVSEERADSWSRYPEFQNEINTLLKILDSTTDKYDDIMQIYNELNPINQVKEAAPICYDMVMGVADMHREYLKSDSMLSVLRHLDKKDAAELRDEPEELENLLSDKAMLVIEYNPAAAEAWERVKSLPTAYTNEFLECLEENPRQDMLALSEKLQLKRTKELRPFDDETSNDALEEARTISAEAEAEFRAVLEMLQGQVEPYAVLKKIEHKFGPTLKTKRLAEQAHVAKLEAERQRIEELEWQKKAKEQQEEADRREERKKDWILNVFILAVIFMLVVFWSR